jgi:hypothetical protein
MIVYCIQTFASKILPPIFPFISRRFCCKERKTMFVMLNEVNNFTESTDKKREILRLSPQNGIVTQALIRKGEGESGLI